MLHRQVPDRFVYSFKTRRNHSDSIEDLLVLPECICTTQTFALVLSQPPGLFSSVKRFCLLHPNETKYLLSMKLCLSNDQSILQYDRVLLAGCRSMSLFDWSSPFTYTVPRLCNGKTILCETVYFLYILEGVHTKVKFMAVSFRLI